MFAYSGRNKKFQHKIKKYNKVLKLFLDSRDEVRVYVYSDILKMLIKIIIHGESIEEWISEKKKATNYDRLGLVHRREILTSIQTLCKDIGNTKSFKGVLSKYLGESELLNIFELRKKLKLLKRDQIKKIIKEEDNINKSSYIKGLEYIEIGGAVVLTGGLLVTGAGGILAAGGTFFCKSSLAVIGAKLGIGGFISSSVGGGGMLGAELLCQSKEKKGKSKIVKLKF